MHHGEGITDDQQRTERKLGFAVREAKKRRHEYVCMEHVLFAILHDRPALR